MRKYYVIISFILLSSFISVWSQSNQLPYKDAKLSAQARTKDLLYRMNMEDKIYQLMSVWDGIPETFDSAFIADTSKMLKTFGKGIGSVQPSFNGIKETVAARNKIQKYLKENTQWGIPTLFVDEGQHGLMKPEATSFPQAIGLACSWDVKLFEQVYAVAASEMRSRGTHQVLSPVVDICRDPRWGRVEETYGEDTYLNGQLGSAAVRGFQGSTDGTVAPYHVAATLKHLAGHGQPEGGINQGPTNISLRNLREYHLPIFSTIIENAHPVAVMPCYNEFDGIPAHANKWLIKDVLRNEWGFNGLLVSDYGSIDQLVQKHFIASTNKEAAEIAFNAGVEYELPVGNFYKYLPQLVSEGKIRLADIDTAVYKILMLKFKLGLFENPYVDEKTAIEISKKENSKLLALKAARESIVLLKNENNLLPLSAQKYKKIAVIGPCANNVFLGGYSGEPYEKVTLLQGIKNKVGNNSEVLFSEGCKLTTNTTISFYNWKSDEIKFASKDENGKLINEAVTVANKCDIIILAIGENEHLCREAWSKEHLGDNMTLDLFGQQDELVKAMVATGKPIVVYLMNGRPLSINYIKENIPAIIEGWYMGEQTGNAAADIIFGDVNPSGKITITFPKSAGQLPLYYNHKSSAQYHNYLSEDSKPLFPFGFGLSYTTFKYSNIRVSDSIMAANGRVTVSADITNTGKVTGDEIAQLYIRDKISSVTRPVKELKGFERITLTPGQTQTVTFAIDASKLAFWDINMKYTVEPGEFELMVGPSSEEYISTKLTVK